jgi:hypothetical protein
MKYIDAGTTAEKISNEFEIPMSELCDVFADIPAADVQPVEHGRWEDCEIRGSLAMRCSVCGNDSGVLYNYAYCPNCGARMFED